MVVIGDVLIATSAMELSSVTPTYMLALAHSLTLLDAGAQDPTISTSQAALAAAVEQLLLIRQTRLLTTLRITLPLTIQLSQTLLANLTRSATNLELFNR